MDTIRNLQKMLSVRITGAKPFVDWFVAELAATFELHQVKPTPCLLMLAEDVVTHGLLVREAHKAFNNALNAAKAKPAEQPSPQAAGGQEEQGAEKPASKEPNSAQKKSAEKKKKPAPQKITKEAAELLDDVFKYREKYRKSMGDFNQACAAAGTPIPTGLSELFANVDAKLDGVMTAAVDFQRRNAPTNGSAVPGAPLDALRPDVQAIAPDTAEAAAQPVFAEAEA